MKKLTALILAMLLASGTIAGCEKDTPGEETTKNPSETDAPKPVETKAPEVPPVEGEIINLADEGILICSNPNVDVTEAFDLDISTAVKLDAANSDNWIGIELLQPAILCYASFSAQDTDYDGTTNSPWDIYGHIIEGSNDGQNWEFILQFGDPYAEYDDYAVEYEKGNNYATEYAFDGESEYDDDATEVKAYRYYRSWNDGKGGPLWGELELWGVLVGEPVETDAPETKAPETKAPETKPVETVAPETKPVETVVPETETPETEFPETETPETEFPETEAPETEFPETEAPETEATETKPVVQASVYSEQDHSEQGFTIKGKGYYYKGNELMKGEGALPAAEVLLLNVTNETDTNYSVILGVTYFDENGKKLKTEKQSFEQFAAGFQRYFMFNPKDGYASYTCELSLTVYTGDVYVDRFSFDVENVYEKEYSIRGTGSAARIPVIAMGFRVTQLPHPALDLSRIVIAFDNTGEIYLIHKTNEVSFDRATETTSNGFFIKLHYTTEKPLVWPKELTGELEGIVIYDIVE